MDQVLGWIPLEVGLGQTSPNHMTWEWGMGDLANQNPITMDK